MDQAISVMHDVSVWMEKQGLNVSQWWRPENMNRNFLLKYAELDEFYVALVNGAPAASVILQDNERNQSWKGVDGKNPRKALYIHWLCVARNFAHKGYSKEMVSFAEHEAERKNFKLLRLDTDAKEKKLCELYEDLGFKLMGIEDEGDHLTAFYQKNVA
ncbi:GNAT family N-acetyltransferase [Candidatus Curtissbacteria bacterium]|nr:GNAT family N-acetyltransferase [Candidatus Curtissbacteria bacterium]